ncbi:MULTISPECIES: acyltransferase [Tenacibaculum]|uniref:acyltransferase n=1 Tax=Tenacibaculum TaxID=104267 RepID=UPI001F0B2452|nr:MULTISPECIES: acyltransferase [Tenacibaculum]MCH3883135.1 acyltransferase [Tenacibaculum aquimarinum]MDO6600873.1 acyltransferase [Tenacibaculum sp. 1_MG-2023]
MKTISKITTFFWMLVYPLRLKLKQNIFLSGKIKTKGLPYIHVKNKSKIFIGENVTLNSSNFGYHINLHTYVKLLADGKESEIHIGDNTRIHGSCIHTQSKISIGKNCLIAANCQIIDNNGHQTLMKDPENRIHTTDTPKPITIKDNVWIGANSFILPGVTIESGSVIAAGSIVSKDVPKNVIIGGVPAKILKTL